MRKTCFAILLFLFYLNTVLAGLPVGKGRSILGVGYNHLYSNKNFDSKWLLNGPLCKDDYFSSNNYSFFMAHGLSRRMDLICNTSFLYEIVKQNGITSRRSDFGDATIGLAYNIENKDYSKYLTFQVSGIFPLYTNPTGTLAMGYGSKGIDLTISKNDIPKFLHNNGSIMYQLSYRNFFAEEETQQLIGGVTFDFVIKRINQVMINFTGLASVSDNHLSSINPNEVRDFESFNCSASYGRRVRRTIVLYCSASYTIIGKNTSQGLALGANMIIKIP